jgi:hypothetical protein
MTQPPPRASDDFFIALLGDGRVLISLTGLSLILSGGFALFLSATGAFLPHDVDYLGMAPAQLCAINQCRIVHFMFHDRVSFGGVLIAIGTLYLWLTHFPLQRGESWAWWVLVVSGITGFGSFLAYLGYGYLDTWHGAATLALLPCFLLGLWKTRDLLPASSLGWRTLLTPAPFQDWRNRHGLGRWCLLLTGLGKMGAGTVIMLVGMTVVFVPQDLHYLGISAAELNRINPRLLPLIAHDRAGFGGGLLSCGILVLLIVWKSPISHSLWQALLISGAVGFVCAIGVHFHIGYLDALHLAPAVAGVALFATGIVCSYRGSSGRDH